MKTLCFALSAAALLVSNGCALVWLGEGGGDEAQGSSASTGPTSSSSSGSGTGGDAGACTSTSWLEPEIGTDGTGCGAPPAGNCDVAAVPSCDQEACTGACKHYDRCTSTGWLSVAFCDGPTLVPANYKPDAGTCTPPDLNTTGATTGCGTVPAGDCAEADAMCVETACTGSCKHYDKCTTTGWFSVAFCDGKTLVKM